MPHCPTELASPLPVLAISAWSGSGKTTLLEQVIPLLVARGIRLAVIKHAHHDVNLDQPGKDSWRLREAGASEVLLASDKRVAWLKETPKSPIALPELLTCFNAVELDLVLVEGFKDEPLPRLVLYRAALGKPLPDTTQSDVLAIVTDTPLATDHLQLPLNDPGEVANFIVTFLIHQQTQPDSLTTLNQAMRHWCANAPIAKVRHCPLSGALGLALASDLPSLGTVGQRIDFSLIARAALHGVTTLPVAAAPCVQLHSELTTSQLQPWLALLQGAGYRWDKTEQASSLMLTLLTPGTALPTDLSHHWHWNGQAWLALGIRGGQPALTVVATPQMALLLQHAILAPWLASAGRCPLPADYLRARLHGSLDPSQGPLQAAFLWQAHHGGWYCSTQKPHALAIPALVFCPEQSLVAGDPVWVKPLSDHTAQG